VRHRKEEELRRGIEKIAIRAEAAEGGANAGKEMKGDVKILTSCPSCLQGLSRFRHDMPIEADYIVVEIAKHVLGEDWMTQYVRRANAGGIERVLL